MTNYNKKLCDILNDINFFVKEKKVSPTDIHEYNKDKEIMNDIKLKLKKIEGKIRGQTPSPEQTSGIKKITDSIKNIGNEISKLNITKTQNNVYLNDIYDKILNLNNKIQNETVNIYNKYSNNTDSLISEQNKQYENFKFNKIYLFLFNLGIIFIIIRNSYYKKTY